MWIRKIYKNIFFISLLICAGFPAIANDVKKAQRLLTELVLIQDQLMVHLAIKQNLL